MESLGAQALAMLESIDSDVMGILAFLVGMAVLFVSFEMIKKADRS